MLKLMTRAAVVASLLSIATVVSGQVLASDTNRREAFRHYRSGQEFLSAEQFEKAAEAFSTAVKYDPLLTDAYYGLGHSYMGLQRYASAIQAFGKCIEAAKSLHSLRQRDRVAGDRAIDEELRELKDTMRRRAGQPLKVMQIEHRIQEVERSRSSLDSGFQAPATVLLSLGSAHFRNGDREAAEQHWAAAVKANAELGEAWNNLAVIHLGAGRKAEAEEAVKNAERTGFRVNPRLKADIRALK
jgi:tetratricopeptide (TPR) repeat protein